MNNHWTNDIEWFTNQLEQTLEYDNVRRVDITYHMDNKLELEYHANDKSAADDKWQGYKYEYVENESEIRPKMEEIIAAIPPRAERELRQLAGAMAKVKELSDECKTIEAKAFGESFAAKLNELRAALPAPTATQATKPSDNITF